MDNVNPDPQVFSAPPPPPQPSVSAGGLSDNIAGALAYVTIIPAILFLILEPYNKRPFVRFNSFQSIALAIIAFALHFLMVIPILGWIVVVLADLVLFVAWIVCVVKALQGTLYKLPLIGPFVDNLVAQG